MYDIDVNFLQDRPEYQKESARPEKRPASAGGDANSNLPLFIGVGVLALLPAMVIAYWQLVLNPEVANLEEQKTSVQAEIDKLTGQLAQVPELNAQLEALNAEVQSMVDVIDQVKPWSAVFQDLSDRIPTGVEVTNIQQTTDADNGQNSIEVQGIAVSFSDVNDFTLLLQESPFLDEGSVKIKSAALVENPAPVSLAEEDDASGVEIELPKVVDYAVVASFNQVPASELERELTRLSAVGITTRIELLKEKGII